MLVLAPAQTPDGMLCMLTLLFDFKKGRRSHSQAAVKTGNVRYTKSSCFDSLSMCKAPRKSLESTSPNFNLRSGTAIRRWGSVFNPRFTRGVNQVD
jgi:hypothetical protein